MAEIGAINVRKVLLVVIDTNNRSPFYICVFPFKFALSWDFSVFPFKFALSWDFSVFPFKFALSWEIR
jgi:hypothetical protein